jgi:Cdc6-like AAA superfamily ATPase|tara:strand:- start:86 stop:934 length:849 start_codon:yes stop_codon:yes gene_type:complete
MEWYEELDFEENPFDINSLESEFELIGRDEEAKEALYMIASGNMFVVEGKTGTGKTALLKYVIDNFKGEGKVVHIDGNKISKKFDIKKLLKKKGMILLMDNVQYLSKKNNQKIKYFYDEDLIKSVVFTTTDFSLVNFTDAIKDRIGKNIIKLKDIKEADALEIIKSRLGDKEILPEDVLKELFKKSKNIKEFITGCSNLCDYVVKSEDEVARKEDIEHISMSSEEEATEADLCPECSDKLIKIGDNWRCEECDKFCTGCGTLVEEEDDVCPECDKEIVGGAE